MSYRQTRNLKNYNSASLEVSADLEDEDNAYIVGYELKQVVRTILYSESDADAKIETVKGNTDSF